ncbi:DNA polymerase III subunit alpha [Streptomyces sp. NPDC057638]|uniref:DNA polymerase III subunit alpha n=1 Tax=Streptomyces sp. NPDC057638 TaxID=3346190 RepID=UPI00368E5D1B
MEGFTHLHVASGYSARYGASHPRDLVRRAAERGMTALAVTDRDTVTGVVRFAKAALEQGVRPVFGVDLAIEPFPLSPLVSPSPVMSVRPVSPAAAAPWDGDPRRAGAGDPPRTGRTGGSGRAARTDGTRSPVRGGAHVIEPPLRFTLLARDAAGWAALCRLVTAAHDGRPGDDRPGRPHLAHHRPAPVLGWADLREFAGPGQGLLALLGPVSEPVRALAAGRPDLAERLLGPWRELFGDGLRLEAVWHGRAGTGPGSLRLAARTLGLGERAGVTTVLGNAVRYADPRQHRLADVLDAARLLRPIGRVPAGRRSAGQGWSLDSGERWLKGSEEMGGVAGLVAEAAGLGPRGAARLLAATAEAAESCRVDPVRDLGLGRRHFPEPWTVGATDAADAARVLRERCEAGLIRRGLDRDPAARARLDEELDLITELEFDTYFLTVAQVVADIREMGVRVAARGSGAGSMVNHVLRIATANPLDHRLLFERFVSRRRKDLPDIDLDVESARRLDVYDRIIRRFGRERVAITAMPETYRARHALRDTGLALGIAPAEMDRIATSFPHIRASDITAALAELPELRRLAAEGDRYRLLFELAEGLDALPRGIAMHPCGVILTDATLGGRVPVQPTPTGNYPMVQADKEDVEDLGMIKLDILGVRMQSAMAHATAEIARVTGRRIDLDDPRQVPLDDPFAFKLIQSSDTLGMFQLESPGQMDLLSRLQPRDPQDVIADISLFRPGPVAGGMPERYVAARHGAAPAYPHPDLAPVLDDTYGVVIWHEQIIEILATLTGCDRAFGDYTRRALGDRERLPRVRDWFHRAAAARGYPPAVRDEVWRTVEAFGSYGFCRAHAVAFAVPALQSAWLKAHHPAALYAGLLEHDPGMWPKRVIVADARRHGIAVLPVDINRSLATHTVERAPDGTWGVRLALRGVRGISEDEVTRIVAGQPYGSLSDLWQRARPHRPTAEYLAEIGALDAVRGGLTRRDLLLQIGELHRQYRGRPLGDGQLVLRTESGTGALRQSASQSASQSVDPSTGQSAGLPEMTGREATGAELRVLGIDVTQHLMDHHHRLLRELGATSARRLDGVRPGETVLVAGVRAATQTPPIASGRRIIFVTLDDGSGLVDLAFFEDSHDACAHTVFHSGLLLVRGTVQRRGERSTVVGAMAWDLEALAVARRDGGPEAVHRLLGPAGMLVPAGGARRGGTREIREVREERQGIEASGPWAKGAPGRRQPHRVIEQETGARLHPWADLQPAGQRTADARELGGAYQGPGGARRDHGRGTQGDARDGAHGHARNGTQGDARDGTHGHARDGAHGHARDDHQDTVQDDPHPLGVDLKSFGYTSPGSAG